MKKKENKLNRVDEILNSLSGHFDIDRKILSEAIYSMRENNESFKDVAKIGIALYRLLLDNGLNESDVINPQRLIDKVDSYSAIGDSQMALNILDVLSSVEMYQKYDKNSKRVFCFENEVEANIYGKHKTAKGPFVWIISNIPKLLLIKAEILLQDNKLKEAKNAINQALELNPVNFSAKIMLDSLTKHKTIKNKVDALNSIWKFAYTKEQMLIYLDMINDIYEDKKDLMKSYAILTIERIYSKDQNIYYKLKDIEAEFNKFVVSPFHKPTNDEIIEILEKENIRAFLPETNKNILIETYKKLQTEKYSADELKEIEEFLIGGYIDGKTIIKEIKEPKTKRTRKNKEN